MKIKWLGHSSFKIAVNGKIIYFDPFSLSADVNTADFILITHEHYDHCSVKDIEKIRSEKTIIVTTAGAAEKIPDGVKIIKEGEKFLFGDINVKAVPAYNLHKSFHPRGLGVGFILAAEEKKIYHAGDTDLIPEMENLAGITVALLPVGGTYTMDAKEAAEAASIIKPEIAIPMHYGKIVGSRRDAEKFEQKAMDLGVTVTVLEKEGGLEI